MLLRKADWHDPNGIELLLKAGSDPNRMTQWGYTALHQAVRRDNHLRNIELLLDHGADPTLPSRNGGRSGVAIAARRGRGDVLDVFERRGIPIELEGVEALIAACARNDARSVSAMAEREPRLVDDLLAQGGTVLAEFAGTGNTEGVRLLLQLGVQVSALHEEGDGYFDIAKNSTALHVAAWRARHETVKLLIEHGALIDVPDGKGRTPLALAVRACVDSYWSDRRSPESVLVLLNAGASVTGVACPCGYDEVDELLRSHGA
jgi:ankyrin repeat protein